jgi:hypothetical protein
VSSRANFEPLKKNVFDQCCGGENEHDDDEYADRAGSQFNLSVFRRGREELGVAL